MCATVAAGIEPRHDECDCVSLRDQWHALVEAHQTDRLAHDHYTHRVSALMNGLYAPAEVHAIHEAWTRGAYDGAVALVDALNERGFVTACLSNTNAAHWRVLVEEPAVTRLHHRFPSHELGLHKPDPKIYEAVQRELSVSAETIIFFDDLPENVEAARAVGWRAELIDPLQPTPPQVRGALRDHAARCSV